MSEKKKKLFPKLKKKISDFLTDESGEITKKDALGVAAGVSLIAGVESVGADTQEVYNETISDYGNPGFSSGIGISVVGKHISGVINGHLSKDPEINIETISKGGSAFHNSHCSHGSGGWC